MSKNTQDSSKTAISLIGADSASEQDVSLQITQ